MINFTDTVIVVSPSVSVDADSVIVLDVKLRTDVLTNYIVVTVSVTHGIMTHVTCKARRALKNTDLALDTFSATLLINSSHFYSAVSCQQG